VSFGCPAFKVDFDPARSRVCHISRALKVFEADTFSLEVQVVSHVAREMLWNFKLDHDVNSSKAYNMPHSDEKILGLEYSWGINAY